MPQGAARAPGLQAEARANRCAPCPPGSRGAASGGRGVRPSHRGRAWPARPRSVGAGVVRRERWGRVGCKLRLSSPLLTFQRPRLAAPRMRPTRSPASRCGRPRGRAQAAKGTGWAGGSATSPLSPHAHCARTPGRRGRIPSPGPGAPGREACPRVGLEVDEGSVSPPPDPSRAPCGRAGVPGSRRAPHSPPGGAQTRRARPPSQRNELSTAALGAARGHARIWRPAGNQGGKEPWGGPGADDGTEPSGDLRLSLGPCAPNPVRASPLV